MAMWAKKEIGHYPPLPQVGSLKPKKLPRRGHGSPFRRAEEPPEEFSDLTGPDELDDPVEGFSIQVAATSSKLTTKKYPRSTSAVLMVPVSFQAIFSVPTATRYITSSAAARSTITTRSSG